MRHIIIKVLVIACLFGYFTLSLYIYFKEVNMQYKGNIKEYIQQSFGWNVRFSSLNDVKNRIPYGIFNAADYDCVEIDNFKGVAIKPHSEDDFRMNKNIATTLEKRLDMPVILILDGINSYQRKSLIESRIGFVVPGKQIYIPQMGALMSERGLGVNVSTIEKLSAVAGAMITLHLGTKSLQGLSISDVAKIMGYSIKTLSLAAAELERAGLISFKLQGRKKLLDFPLSNKELWEKAFPMIDSPVEKLLFSTNSALASEIGVISSDSALSEISMLTSPPQNIYAVYARNPQLGELDLNDSMGDIKVEVWKTDPTISSKDGIMDIFSLALSYKNDDDPRVWKELNKLINEAL